MPKPPARVLTSSLGQFLLLFVTFAASDDLYAQTVDFNNTRTFSTPADRKVYAVDGTPLVGTHFAAQLYYGANAGSLTPVTSNPVRFRNVPRNDPLAGTWSGATRTLTGMAAGTWVTLQVRAWDASGGLSFDEARLLGRDWGESATFQYPIWSGGTAPDLFYIDNFRAFTLVPEPSVIGLAVFGLGGLLFLTRKSRQGREKRRCEFTTGRTV